MRNSSVAIPASLDSRRFAFLLIRGGVGSLEDDDRREHERFPTEISVDVRSGEHFLFAYITNISEMGIFVRTDDIRPIGTRLRLRFSGPDDVTSSLNSDGTPIEVAGTVTWVNPVRIGGDNLNPGMGVRFENLTPELREQLVELVRAIAYLHEHAQS